MISRHAEAGKTTGGSPIWELPRSPFVPHRATPSALECEMDEDDDGLDDEIEGLLADRFVPVIRFASGEKHVKPVSSGVVGTLDQPADGGATLDWFLVHIDWPPGADGG